MAYMNADTGNKVGYRPYGGTNPQGAANLSGWRAEQSHNPFMPGAWHLHGYDADGNCLGIYEMNRPFDPWELHGSGVSGLGYIGDANGNAGTDDQVAQAADDLLAAGSITQAEHDAILNGSMNFQDVLGYDPTDQTSWVNAVGMLQTWNSQLQAIEAQVTAVNNANLQSGTQPTAAFTALTQQVQQQRSSYNSLANEFISVYSAATGNVPTGLTGLGIIPLVVYAAGAAVILVAIYFAYQAFQTWKASINVQQTVANTAAAQQASTAATNAQLLTQLNTAQATGNTPVAQAILSTLTKTAAVPAAPTPMSAIETWLTSNAMWLGLGVGALVILPNLLGGGRRR
jgi:hypothetical protein